MLQRLQACWERSARDTALHVDLLQTTPDWYLDGCTLLRKAASWAAHRFDPMVAVLPSLVPDGFIYLRAEPEDCKARMMQRGRSEEGTVELGYLQQLHTMHEEWFRQVRLRCSCCLAALRRPASCAGVGCSHPWYLHLAC